MAASEVSKTRTTASILSLAAFTALVFFYLWWGRFEYSYELIRTVTYASAVALVLGNHFVHRDSLRSLGLRIDNLAPASLWYGGFTLLGLAILCLAGLFQETLTPPGVQTFFHYLFWATLQQHILQNFLRRRSQEVWVGFSQSRFAWAPAGGALTASALFALYHLPNPGLMFASFFGAVCWCFLFIRIPSLPGAVLSQALLAMTLMTFFKSSALQQFEVGLPGYRYQYYGQGVTVAGGYDGLGRARVATLPGPDRGQKAWVRVFDTDGNRLSDWVAFPELDFSGILSVGDLGYGPGDEVAVAPGPGGGNPPLVRIFDLEGHLLGEISVPDIDNGYGAWPSIACGRLLISAGPAPQALGQVMEFRNGNLERRWVFPELGLVNGVRATAACARPPGTQPEIQKLLLWGSDIAVNPSTMFLFDPQTAAINSFETLTTTFGAQATLLEWQPGQTAVAVAPGALRGYPPLIGVYTLEGEELFRFSPYGDEHSHGANLGAVDADADGRDELIVGEGVGPNRPFTVRLYRLDGRFFKSWEAYP